MRMQHIVLSSLMAGLLLVGPVVSAKAAADTTPASPSVMDESRGPRGNSPFMDLTPEKRSAFIALVKEHKEKIFPIREQLWAKETTLYALQNNPKTDPQQITTLVSEMSALRAKLHTERLAFDARVKKEIGIDLPAFHGGRGDGYGCYDGGRGPRHGGGWGHRGGMRGDGGQRGGMGGMGMHGSQY